MKKLHFKAPEDWVYIYDEGEEDIVDEEGEYYGTNYVEKLVASAKYGFYSFQVTAFHGCPEIGGLDLVQQEVEDYLSDSGFVIPEYLMPSPEDLIEKCQIDGNDAYYYLIQKPGEEKANIRIILDVSDTMLVYIDASMNHWWDKERMISFLTDSLLFVEG